MADTIYTPLAPILTGTDPSSVAARRMLEADARGRIERALAHRNTLRQIAKQIENDLAAASSEVNAAMRSAEALALAIGGQEYLELVRTQNARLE